VANITLGEGLLAAGSGLFKGLNANREKREADRRYEDQVAYQRSRQAIEDQYNKLRLDNERVKNDAYRDSVLHQTTPEERKNALDAKLKSSAADREIRKYLGSLSSYTTLKAALLNQRGLTERQRADILASQGREVGTMARSIASRMSDLQNGLDFLSPEEQAKAIDEINSLREQKDSLESQVPELFQRATGVLDYDPGTAPPMPVAPGEEDGPDVPGATDDAIETPAAPYQKGPGVSFPVSPAPTLGSSMQGGGQGYMTPTLGAAMGATSGHEPGPIPPDVQSGIHKELVAKGYTPGSNAYNKAFTMAAIGWQKKNRPVSQ